MAGVPGMSDEGTDADHAIKEPSLAHCLRNGGGMTRQSGGFLPG